MNLYDLAYLIGGGLTAPLWLLKPNARRKVRQALHQRMGHLPARIGNDPAVMIHAVSLGEINATRELIRRLRQARPGLKFIVSTTTETGFARGTVLYGKEPDVTLIRYPLDFSWAVRRVLENLRPSVVALMELEVWPNFLRACRQRRIPVVLINGRLTEKSFARYRLLNPLVRGMFRRLDAICAQDQTYALRFEQLGADATRVTVTGTMKFDTAEVTDTVKGAAEMAAAVGLSPATERIWVCGSTGPGEEKIVLDEYRKLLPQFPKLRLVIVPRKPERFDEVAQIIRDAGFDCRRRSQPAAISSSSVILGDTMGELRAWYSLADCVFVGRSLVDLGVRQHGSDMIEPAAIAKPAIVGPYTGNFAEPMDKFMSAHAMKRVSTAEELGRCVADLLADPPAAAELGRRARQVVLAEQGATDRHVTTILQRLA